MRNARGKRVCLLAVLIKHIGDDNVIDDEGSATKITTLDHTAQ